MWKQLFVVVVAGTAFFSSEVKAVNGALYELTPSKALQDAALHGVGALMMERELEDTKGKKTLTYAGANAIYIGNSKKGSLLLVSARTVTTDGKADYQKLAGVTLQFGSAVTDLRTGVASSRALYRLPPPAERDGDEPGVEIWEFPGYRESKGTSSDSLALIQLPYHLPAPRRPISLIESGKPIPKHAPYYVFGFGHQFEEPSDPTHVFPEYEKEQTSGFLMMAALKLVGHYQKEGLMRLTPLSADEWKNIHQSDAPQTDGFVDGPCENDAAAPLLMEANQIIPTTDEKSGKQLRLPKSQVVLVGMHRASAGTCKRGAGKDAVSAFLDLGKGSYRTWIETSRARY